MNAAAWLGGTFLALAAAGGAHGAEWQTRILVATSLEEAQAWLDLPARRREEAADKPHRVAAGQKVFVPIVASGAVAGSEVRLAADIAFFAPDGRMLWESKRCCEALLRGARGVLLLPAASVVLVAGDAPGLYTVRATVSDGTRRQLMKETFSYAGSRDAVK